MILWRTRWSCKSGSRKGDSSTCPGSLTSAGAATCYCREGGAPSRLHTVSLRLDTRHASCAFSSRCLAHGAINDLPFSPIGSSLITGSKWGRVVPGTIVIGSGSSPLRSRVPVICHLSHFYPRSRGSFIDALSFLAMHCRDRLKIETLFLFPEKARANTWVKEFEERGIMHALIPENRNRFLAARALLDKYQP